MFQTLLSAPAFARGFRSRLIGDEPIIGSLRFTLTANSMLKMLALAALVSGLAYGLVTYYLGFVTDQALLETMATEYVELGLPLPHHLQKLEQNWHLIGQLEEAYDDEDIANLVVSLDAQARVIPRAANNQTPFTDPDLPDRSAAEAALTNGSDLRTVFTGNGLHVRLLTYRLPPGSAATLLQLGRVLVDEDRIKHRLLLVIFALGILLTVLSGFFSWWSTGRSLRPTRRAWEQQQAFVANASHELRTPLTLIRASTQVLQLSLRDELPQRQLLDDVITEADYMSRLVDDMLVLSRLDAGQLELDLGTIELAELLPQLARPFMCLASERGVNVCVKCAEGAIMADHTHIWQVLLIVLDNALRHTPRGGKITIGSELRESRVHISVEDTGEGIAPDDLLHVFERFYKADRSRGDRHSAGLGLSIAKSLIELHGGEIDIHSLQGVRTVVRITLPACPALRTADPQAGLSPAAFPT